MKTAWILLPIFLLGGGSAHALDTYCLMKGGTLHAGTETTRDWYVVNDTVRKPQLPGQKKASIGCSISFHSIGQMYRPIEIVTKPKLGQAKTGHYRLYYRSAKNGNDLVTVRFHRVGRTGALESSVVHYRIQIIDRPL